MLEEFPFIGPKVHGWFNDYLERKYVGDSESCNDNDTVYINPCISRQTSRESGSHVTFDGHSDDIELQEFEANDDEESEYDTEADSDEMDSDIEHTPGKGVVYVQKYVKEKGSKRVLKFVRVN